MEKEKNKFKIILSNFILDNSKNDNDYFNHLLWALETISNSLQNYKK